MARQTNITLPLTVRNIMGKVIPMIQQIAWIGFLVLLPVTNFPYLPSNFGGDFIVKPISILPLVVLIFIGVIPHLATRSIPGTVKTLFPFILFALASSALSLLTGINSNFGVSVPQRILRNILALGIGVAIYLTVAITPRSFADLRRSLRWLYLGFGVAMAWGTLQAVYVIHFTPAYYRWISQIQQFISDRRLFENRVSGLTYEPNWFGEQLAMLLVPWLVIAILHNYSVFRWRWRRITVESLLLVWCIVMIIFTFSRSALINIMGIIFVAMVFLRPKKAGGENNPIRTHKPKLSRVGQALLIILVLVTVIYVIGANNTFISRLWNYWSPERQTNLDDYLQYIGFGARYIYGETALRVFMTSPWLGVGLGNYAFYFEDLLSERFIAETPEVLRLLTQNVERFRLMTPKNLYLRILAETGLLGMAAFSAFLIAVLGCALYLVLSNRSEERYWGAAGVCVILSCLLAAFTFDSFAIPNMWVVFGLVTAAAWVSRPNLEIPSSA